MKIPSVNTARIRKMAVGDVVVFSAGKKTNGRPRDGQLKVTMIASRLGYSLRQKTMALVDPVTCESEPVIAVERYEDS